jgi:hypothetical protein
MPSEVDMTHDDKKSPPGNPSDGDAKTDDDSIIPGRHGKHGGGMESEGSPQEQSPTANEPRERNGADRIKH